MFQKMKICLIAHSIRNIPSGVLTHAYNLLKTLSTAGHSVTLIILADEQSFNSSYLIPNHFGLDTKNVKLVRVGKDGQRAIPETITKLEEVCTWKDFDLTHAHFLVPAGLVGAIIKRRFGLPLVVTAHGSDVTYLMRHPLYSPLTRLVLTEADKVIVVRREMISQLRKNIPEITENRLSIVPNGVDTKFFTPKKAENLRSSLDLENQNVILYVGRLSREKGLLNLLEAVSHVRRRSSEQRLTLVLAGSGPQQTSLEKLSSRLGIRSITLFLGNFPYRNLPSLYSLADLFVLPSIREGFPLSLLEAMACERTVITTTSGNPGLIRHGENGFLVKPGKQAELAKIIEMLINDSDTRDEIGKAARRTVCTYYTWNKVVQSIIRIYRQTQTQEAPLNVIS
jgi:glycosyltransferase involved in cell wall biosynthesis